MVSATPSAELAQPEPETANREPQDELIKCICNLCQCGRHSCNSYQFYRQQQPPDPLPDNRCSRSSTRMSPATEHAAGAHCCCLRELTEERYLGFGGLPDNRVPSRAKSVASRQSLGSPENGDSDKLQEDELMHVLLTKPQVASKPRDNIIFEGDMDLRTTFETTYEALAKMRLDCWKKYREGTAGYSQVCPASSQKMMLPTSVSPGDISKQVSFRQAAGGAPPELAPQQAAGHLLPEGEQPVMEASYGGAKATSETSPHQMLQPEKPEEERCEQLAERPASIISNATPSRYIDPDVASIMVYNANLDRLEKVGSRKRSKHRPLTSLRSGGRGLFGDQPEHDETHRKCETPQQVSANLKGSKNENQAASLIRGPQQQQQQPMMATTSATTEPAAVASKHQHQPSPTSLGSPELQSIKLNARNQTNSSQPQNSLLYSDENLPVDSKRKVRNNVNMIDHIRDQNIIESHYSAKAAAPPPSLPLQPSQTTATTHYLGEQLGSPMLDKEPQSELLSAADLLLARKEEAEVLEEIKKLTSSAAPEAPGTAAKFPEVGPKPPQSVPSLPPGASQSVGENDLCRQRLQRTCQHQNFYISDNNYTTYLDQPSETHPQPASQQHFYNNNNNNAPSISYNLNSQYNNLFRESPDFILATGAFGGRIIDDSDLTSQTETKIEQPQSSVNVNWHLEQEVKPQTPIGDAREADGYLNDEPQMNNCKVEELNDSYHYVGTKGGHKYFCHNNK